jgi:hypothetical protein
VYSLFAVLAGYLFDPRHKICICVIVSGQQRSRAVGKVMALYRQGTPARLRERAGSRSGR